MSKPIKWTDEQEAAINFPSDRSACVTAAAGSGKTALLVERVVRLIKGDPEQDITPVSADKFAILTFTRNAADEFRTRMTKAIDAASRSREENAVSREQLIKFRSSVVSTINSFCLGVLRENAELFDLPVNFSIVEESKGLIMRQKALDNAMEYFYSEEFAGDFPAVYSGFGGSFSAEEKDALGDSARELLHKSFSFSTDVKLREAVTAVFLRSTSLADSEEWLDGCAEVFSSVEKMEQRFLPIIVSDLRRQCRLLSACMGKYRTMCENADSSFSERFLSVLEVDEIAVRAVLDSFDSAFPEGHSPTIPDFERFNAGCTEPAFGAFSRSGIPRNNPDYKQMKADVDAIRKRIQKYCADIREGCGYSADVVKNELVPQQRAVTALVMLVRRLHHEFTAIKRKAGVVDFADCERMLLDKLRDGNCGLRGELSQRYQCIILDEFQDTNDLQYEIFRLISREQNNLFFVGDIKQSIYAFRGGNPEIMARCCTPGSGFEALPLNMNFRSREGVIRAVNAMFDGVMTKKYGEVDYSDNNQLTRGADYPEDNADHSTEMYLLDFPAREKPGKDSTATESDDLLLEATNPVAEARFTAALIQKMAAEKFPVKQDADSTRPCTWGDFAILLRSRSHFTEYRAELEKLGIPVAASGGSSYLSADEINLILDYLKVIDNPQLDEELLTVIMSPLYGMTAEDISRARLGILGYDVEALDNSGIDLKPLYDSFAKQSLFCCIACAGGSDLAQPELSEQACEILAQLEEAGLNREIDSKCAAFSEDISAFRTFAANNSVERLIRRIYDGTDFFSVISTYERGDRKLANIRLLLKYTADFENSGGGTLNDFLRYTDAVRENSGQLEEAVIPQEASDAVKIMTFHASKGLEMPIVILGGLGTALHDERASSIVIDRRTGIGLKNTLINQRLRLQTVSFNGAQASVNCSQIGEELRLLYVAMTRAREKLIMIGQCTGKSAAECVTDSFTPEFALAGNSHIKWILSSLLRYGNVIPATGEPVFLEGPGVKISFFTERLPEPDSVEASVPEFSGADEDVARFISETLKETYPYTDESALHSRFSVTELAHMDEPPEDNDEVTLTKPVFLTPEKAGLRISGILVGNTYHHIMELFPLETLRADFSDEDMSAAVENAIDTLCENERLRPEEIFCLENGRKQDMIRRITLFFLSGLGQDMLTAQKLEREYEIFAELPAAEIIPGAAGTTILQGRVDMMFIKDGKAVVVDYKSDSAGSLENELPAYSRQLALYKKILPILMPECRNGEVKLALYSFGQNKAIYL